ncbi:MAG: DUF1496 domain-containing protein [Gammaproteobacteria bacterium]
MKHFILTALIMITSTPAYTAILTVDDFYHNPLVLDAKNITLYRKLGCIFDNKFYSEGTVLKFADGNRQCVNKNDRHYWDR